MSKSCKRVCPKAKIDSFLAQDDARILLVLGPGGSGKTQLIKEITSEYNSSIALVAPTGIAASHIKGYTLHSYCGYSSRDDLTGPPRYKTYHMNIELVLLDEVSMVSCEMIECLDRILRTRNKNDEAFGGAKLIMFGDEYQMPPVASTSALYSELYEADPFKVLYLKQVYRQKHKTTVKVLNIIRKGNEKRLDAALDHLNKRCVRQNFDQEGSITLCARNDIVEKHNRKMLKQLCSGAPKEYQTSQGKPLSLKVETRVIATINDPKRRFYNGSFGTVTALKETGPKVLFDGAKKSILVPNSKYSSNTDKPGSKIPLNLGYAVTIHKAQGHTFDRVFIDLTDRFFEPGQLYVALSRVRSFNDLCLSRELDRRDVLPVKELARYIKKFDKWK